MDPLPVRSLLEFLHPYSNINAMSNQTSEKWIIKDASGKRYGESTYPSRGSATADLPKLQESSGAQSLSVVQLLEE